MVVGCSLARTHGQAQRRSHPAGRLGSALSPGAPSYRPLKGRFTASPASTNSPDLPANQYQEPDRAQSPVYPEDEAYFFIRNLRALPWQKVAVWLLVALVGWQLSDFFGICMGTFILTFVGRSFSVWIQSNSVFARLIPQADVRRRLIVLLYFITIAGILSVFGLMTIPVVIREGADFIQRLQAQNIWEVVLEKMRLGLGDNLMDQLERFLLLLSHEDVMQAPDCVEMPMDMPWTTERLKRLGGAIYTMVQGYTDRAIQLTSSLLSWVTHFTLQVGISLILTFLFLWDWPNITQGVTSIQNSRLKGIYQEVAPSLQVFAQLFGKALQAQTRIAVVNTLLTFLGMWTLGIPGLLLLSLFVFLCSFIPVAGCIISTVPIGFVALTEYGFKQLALVILMVFLVHAVEAYGLNPAIYSAHLRLHPLLVLTVLVFAEHSMGVWGLLLAVPITVFTLDYCIRYPKDTFHGVAERELVRVDHNYGSMDDADGTRKGGDGVQAAPLPP